ARHAVRDQCCRGWSGNDFRRRYRDYLYHCFRRPFRSDLQRRWHLAMNPVDPHVKIEICELTMAFGSFVIMRVISANIMRSEFLMIMGGSGCGKSTLLRHMIGLKAPAQGDILYDGEPFWHSSEEARQSRLRSFGVLFQSGALWSSMTLAENV